MKDNSIPTLVAHRGYPKHYPENSLPGIEAALRAGANCIEIDIQLTADGIPVLFHDENLHRTTGQKGIITEMTLEQVSHIKAGEPARLGRKFQDTDIPTLDDLVALLQNWPSAKCFVEIKEESLQRFGISTVTDSILERLDVAVPQYIPISYNADAIDYARKKGATAIGWVMRQYNQASQAAARQLLPDYLICNHTKIAASPEILWPGPWQWMLYEVTDASLALTLAARGADFIETMEIAEMLQHPTFKTG